MSLNLNKDLIIVRTIKAVITLIGFSLFIGCEDVNEIEPIEFELISGLTEDANGYYHMALDINKWQTLHRIEGRVVRNGEGVNIIKFAWLSNHYWLVGDTLGYAIENTGSDELWYIGYDTTYITWFSGHEVPIVNGASYTFTLFNVTSIIEAPLLLNVTFKTSFSILKPFNRLMRDSNT